MRLHLLSEEEQKTAVAGEFRVCPKCSAEAIFNKNRWECLNPDCMPTYHEDYYDCIAQVKDTDFAPDIAAIHI